MPNKPKTENKKERNLRTQVRENQRGFRRRDQALARLLAQDPKARRHFRKYGTLPPAIAAYFDALEHPENAAMVKVPIQINNVYSTQTITAKTMCVESVAVAGGGSSELAFFPGHSQYAFAASAGTEGPLDLQSAHSRVQQLANSLGTAAQSWVMGPMSDGTDSPAIGYRTVGSGMTQSTAVGVTNYAVTSLAGFSCTPFEMTPLPYSAVRDDNNHTRWRLVSFSVKLVNKTPEINRGGLVSSVQPSNHFTPSTSAALGERDLFQNFPSYVVHDSDHNVRITWVPRPEDISFWHSANHSTASSAAAGIRIWLDAPASYPQTWEVSVHANWEIAGANYRAIASPAIQHPKSEEIIPQSLAVAKRSKAGASFMTKIGRVMHAAADGAAHMAENSIAAIDRHPALAMGAGIGALASKLLPRALSESLSQSIGVGALEVPLLL